MNVYNLNAKINVLIQFVNNVLKIIIIIKNVLFVEKIKSFIIHISDFKYILKKYKSKMDKKILIYYSYIIFLNNFIIYTY
jgi:hypothetical protein